MSIIYETRNDKIYCGRANRLHCGAHLHSNIEIVCMLDGHSTAWIDDVKYSLSAGDIFFSFPNQVHRYETTDHEDYIILLFSKDLCREFNPWFKHYIPERNVLHREDYADTNLIELLQLIEKNKKRRDSELGQIEIRGYIISFLAALFRSIDFVKEKMEDMSVVKRILTYCTENYTEDLSLELLEKDLHINRFYISHLFSKKLKIRFNDYINSLRISCACKLLLESDMTMTEIIFASGFTTTRTFNRVFLKTMGQTPSQYRKESKNS